MAQEGKKKKPKNSDEKRAFKNARTNYSFAKPLSALFVIQQQQAVVTDCQAGTDLHISGGNVLMWKPWASGAV